MSKIVRLTKRVQRVCSLAGAKVLIEYVLPLIVTWSHRHDWTIWEAKVIFLKRSSASTHVVQRIKKASHLYRASEYKRGIQLEEFVLGWQ